MEHPGAPGDARCVFCGRTMPLVDLVRHQGQDHGHDIEALRSAKAELLKASRKAQLPFLGLWFIAFSAYLLLEPRPSTTLLFLFFFAFLIAWTATRAYVQRLLTPDARALLKDRLRTPRPCDICGLYVPPREIQSHVSEHHAGIALHRRRVRNAYFAALGGGMALLLVAIAVNLMDSMPRPAASAFALISLIVFFLAISAPLVYFAAVESKYRARAREAWRESRFGSPPVH